MYSFSLLDRSMVFACKPLATMGNRKDKESNPLQAWRKKEKDKASKAKKKARDEKLAEIPAHRRDPAPLVSEIYRLSVLEYDGKLNSDMKQHKKRLFDQFQSIKKARKAAGLETIELVEFDPVAHEAAKLNKRQKTEVVVKEIVHKAGNEPVFESLPELPDGPCPNEEELIALGLPAYSRFPYETFDDEDEVEEKQSESDHFNDLEAQLEAEYELFKESLDHQ